MVTTRANRRRERGSYLVLAAFIMVTLIMVAALAVDISRKYMLEQKCQDVADAAAMAGAQLLPSISSARTACSTYIQQAAGAWYSPRESDILITSSMSLCTGAVGVLVRGAWDPLMMPDWLLGDQTYGVSRYAIAVLDWETILTTDPGPYDPVAGGEYALFIGDSDMLTSTFSGNNTQIIGNAQFNHAAAVLGNGSEIESGTLYTTDLVGSITGNVVEDPNRYIEPPQLDESEMVSDVVLDPSNPYYAVGVFKDMLDQYGNVVRDQDGNAVQVKWTGTQWEVVCVNSSVRGSAGGQNNNLGAGIDVEIIGDVKFDLPNSSGGGAQNYWEGSIRSTGRFLLNTNNAEIRTVYPSAAEDGKDNAGVAIYSGYLLPQDQLAFDNGGNALNVYGTLYAEGSLYWHGNMSNPQSSDPGTSGTYDANGNGFIKGMVYADNMSINLGGGNPDNNLKIWYDAAPLNGLPITNKQSLPRFSTPRVWLKR